MKARAGRIAGAIVKGYGRLLKGALILAAAGIGILLSGYLIVYPLWLLSNRHKSLYGILALVLLVTLVLVLAVRRLGRTIAASGGLGTYLKKRFFPFLIRCFAALIGAGFLYFGVLCFSRGSLIAGVLASGLFILFLGFVLFSRHDPA